MLRRKKTQQKIEELNGDHFTYRKSVVHGFPTSPSAIAFEPELGFLILGTSKGELKVCGQPGVEYVGMLEPRACITHIFTFGKLHQFLTVANDNSIALWTLKDDDDDGRFFLSCQKRYALSTDAGKVITSCSVSRTSGYIHLGTEGGNVYSLDIKSFDLTNSVIFWNNATALSQPAAQTHPGAVKSLEPCPADPNKLLIGYELGLISLWDLENGIPTRNYPGTMAEQLTPVEALAWHPSGRKFLSSHSNGTITSWTEGHNSKDDRLPVNRYGDDCCAITKLAWLDSETEPMVIFSGGLPTEEEGEHHAVSIHHGANAVALDLTSPVLDFVAVPDPHTNKGEALIVLAEQELVAFDLTTPKVLPVRQPYLHPIHASHITCMKVLQNCSQHLFEKLTSVAEGQNKEKYSAMEWPAMGGFVKEAPPKTYDILISGHENGTVKFWDVTTMGQDFMFEVQTANCFKLEDQEDPQEEGSQEFKWPPYRRVGRYDPLGDDTRLAITQLEFCPSSRNLVVGGAGGQVILFTLANTTNLVRVESIQAVVIPKGDRRNTWKGEESMTCVNRALRYEAGFQPRFVLQVYPPAPISALDFKANWGCIAVGTAHGFAVGNYLLNNIVLTHCTLAEDGSASHHLTRMQSIRRSLRNSVRRRSSRSGRRSSTMERQQEPRRQAGAKAKRTGPEPAAEAQGGTLPYINLQAAVTHMMLSETYLAGPDPSPALVASTMGSVLIRYSLHLPPTGERISEPSIAMLAGKDYALLHGAPVVGVFVLDHAGLPIPSVYEQDNQLAPAPEMAAPHFGVIVTEEQIKVILLPSLKAKCKEKVMEEIHQKIRKAFLIRVKVLAPAGSPRDWHPALMVFTTYGTALVYSLPVLKLCCIVKNFVDPNDIRAQRSITVSSSGEVFYMSSYSEIQRCIFCAYNGSYHISQKPSLYEFAGSTKPRPPRVRPASPSNLPPGGEADMDTPLPDMDTPLPDTGPSLLTVVDVHKPPEAAPLEDSKPTDEQLLKEAEEYLKAVPSASTPAAAEMEVLKSTIDFTRSRADSTSSSSSSSSSSSDEGDVGEGEEVVVGNPMAFEDSEQSGKQLDSIIETSLQELNNARKFYQEMQAKAKKSGD